MDQITIFEQLQLVIDTYDRVINRRYDAMQADMVLLIDRYYGKYGESITNYAKYNRLQALQKEIDTTAAAHYQQLASDLQQAEEEVFSMSYVLYAYLLYLAFGEEDGELLPLTSAAAKTSVVIALVLLLLKAAKKPQTYFMELQVDVSVILTKHKNDYVYGLSEDLKANLRNEAGQKDASEKVKKRSQAARGYGVTRMYELLNDVINYVQEKVFRTATNPNEETKQTDHKEKDTNKRRNLKEVVNDAVNSTKSKINDIVGKQLNLTKMWVSMKDHRVRLAHRILDGVVADEEGWFHYRGDKAKKPKGFTRDELNFGCRCKLLLLINGKLPRTSKIYDYQDAEYQRKLNRRMAELIAEDKTHLQAYRQAQNEIKAPKRTLKGYITFEEFWDKYGPNEVKK